MVRVEAADHSGRRGVVQSAGVPGGCRIRPRVGTCRLPRPGDALLPDFRPRVRVETDDVLSDTRLVLRENAAADRDEAGIALTQLARPKDRWSVLRPGIDESFFAGNRVEVRPTKMRPIGCFGFLAVNARTACPEREKCPENNRRVELAHRRKAPRSRCSSVFYAAGPAAQEGDCRAARAEFATMTIYSGKKEPRAPWSFSNVRVLRTLAG